MNDSAASHSFTATELSRLRRGLLSWFRRHAQPMPWRTTRDPYAIWVSEVMLQQTQVRTVIPYFERFMQRFPHPRALAEASVDDVLKHWEGLGYYRRAMHLHRAAQWLMQHHDGRVPNEKDLFAQLPGVGRYTLGAVLSQAFDRRLPVVDGNVARVLCRWLAWRKPLKAKQTQDWLWSTAERLLPKKAVGDFNQALMELGQQVCKPRQPDCTNCPLRRGCGSLELGLQDQIPVSTPATKSTPLHTAMAMVFKKGRVLVVRRPDKVRWANMWEFPQWECTLRNHRSLAHHRLQLRTLTGLAGRKWRRGIGIRHAVTRFTITFQAWHVEAVNGTWQSAFYSAHRWLKPNELGHLAFSRPMRRFAEVLADGQPHR